MQKLAWERHGFRAANFAGTDSISRFGVAGTLDQIPAVSELPNNDAMQHLITTLQSAQAKLVADISMYDTMYTQNAQQYRELKMTVLAGKKALADFFNVSTDYLLGRIDTPWPDPWEEKEHK